jgi:hypothetical protein
MFQVAIAFILGCAFNSLISGKFRYRSSVIKRSEEQQAELVILKNKVCAIRNELRNKITLCGQLSERNTILRERCRRLSVLANKESLKGLTGDLRGRCGYSYVPFEGYSGSCDGYDGYDGYNGYGHVIVKRASYEV